MQFSTAVSSPAGIPTGKIRFLIRSGVVATVDLSAEGTATYVDSTLLVGDHSITAEYLGDSRFLGSTSKPVTQVIEKSPTSITISSSVNPGSWGNPVEYLLSVAGEGGTPTGSVRITQGSTVLGQATLSKNGTAIISISGWSVGTRNIVAVYEGDGNFAPSTSLPLTQVIQLVPDAETSWRWGINLLIAVVVLVALFLIVRQRRVQIILGKIIKWPFQLLWRGLKSVTKLFGVIRKAPIKPKPKLGVRSFLERTIGAMALFGDHVASRAPGANRASPTMQFQ